MNEAAGVSIFFSYSHRDEGFRESLETHLAILHRKKLVCSWSDRKIIPGTDWRAGIESELNTADIILLLISSDFIASDFCYEKELQVAMDRHEQKQAIVVPIIVRPCDWSDTPFSKLQSLPKDANPVTCWGNQDEAWLDVVNGLKRSISEILLTKDRMKPENRMFSLRDVLRREVDNIDKAFQKSESDSTARGLSTGLKSLDYLTDGLHKQELIVVAGRPEMGKTDLVAQFAVDSAVRSQYTVLFFSLKMPSENLVQRFMSSLAQIPKYTLARGELQEVEWPRFSSAVSLLAEASMRIDDSFYFSIDGLAEKIRSENAVDGETLVVIDGLQHIDLNDQVKSKESKSNIVKRLKLLARELNIPIVVTVTLNRSVDMRPSKRPILQDLSDWPDLEEEASLILFLYRDEAYYPDSDQLGLSELIIAKNVSGYSLGTLRVKYTNKICHYYDDQSL